MDCKSCKESREIVSRHVHEADLDRSDRNARRWFVAWLITFLVLIACVVYLFWYKDQWETVEETITNEVVQDADEGGNNKFVGGDYYGSADSPND
jgi:hypothetical protein